MSSLRMQSLLPIAWFFAVSGIAVCGPIVAVQPLTVSATPGESFSVDVVANDITDLFAFQFDLGFNPSALMLNSVTEGSFLPSGGSTLFIPGMIDNVGGVASSNADTLLTAISGVTGSGTLATFDFTAIGPGTSSLTIFNQILLDSSLSGITADLQNGSVNVSGVPETSTILLTVSGLLALLALRRSGPSRPHAHIRSNR